MAKEFDPRPMIRKDFYALLDRLELEKLEIHELRPWKLDVVVRTDGMDAQDLAVSTHQKIRRIISNGQYRFLIKSVEIGLSYVTFHLAPDWPYYMEQRAKHAPATLEVDDIIPI
jgi:hypothetical protein